MLWHWMLDKNAGQVLVCNTRKTHVRSCNSPPERHSDVCPQCIFKILNGASKCGPSWSGPNVFFQIQLFNILRCCASASLAFFCPLACFALSSLSDLWTRSSFADILHCSTTMPSLHLRSTLFSSWLPASSCLRTLWITILTSFSLRRFDPLRLILSSWLVCPCIPLSPITEPLVVFWPFWCCFHPVIESCTWTLELSSPLAFASHMMALSSHLEKGSTRKSRIKLSYL